MAIRLTAKQKEEIKSKFTEYVNSNKTTYDISNEFGVNHSTIGKFYSKIFGEEYRKTAKLKSHKHCTKVTNEEIEDLFDHYKNGIPMIKLAESVKVHQGTLALRMGKLIGQEYKKIACIRQHENAGDFCRKVIDTNIKKAFEKYKQNSIPLTTLAEELGLAENTLIFRFKRLFKDEYNNLALKRRDERRVSKDNYIKAFEEYKCTSITLTELANKLNVRISSLRPRFLRLFGEEYIKIAAQKADGLALINRGKTAELLALEYLKLKGIKVSDVRRKAILKGTLKRPDFVFENTFIEIKSNYIRFLYKKKIKGYQNIIDDYLGKETKDGKTLTKGMIVSLGGFSEEVIKKAQEDGIILIDDKNLNKIFEEYKRYDLIELISKFKGKI